MEQQVTAEVVRLERMASVVAGLARPSSADYARHLDSIDDRMAAIARRIDWLRKRPATDVEGATEWQRLTKETLALCDVAEMLADDLEEAELLEAQYAPEAN